MPRHRPLAIAVFALLLAATGMAATVAAAQTRDQAIERISGHFTEVPAMSGEFIQFGPQGQQTGGKFFIKRPGRIRFIYDQPSPIQVISDGKTVAVNNRALKTWDMYPLSGTPLRLLLEDRIDIAEKAIRSVELGADVTTVVLGDKKMFGRSEITLMFDPKSYELRQWTIRDSQGKETSVMIFNVNTEVQIPEKTFFIDQLVPKNQLSSGDK